MGNARLKARGTTRPQLEEALETALDTVRERVTKFQRLSNTEWEQIGRAQMLVGRREKVSQRAVA